MGKKLTLDEVGVAPEHAAQVIYDLRRERDRYRSVLGYIASPSMGRPSGMDPEHFARFEVDGIKAKTALAGCIRAARIGLENC